ncbi:unnamed protein product, partial [Mesorhabditis belari]|uniref:DSBA-like thioredoxin domain-containing protein n=1 Tax=Mesorhabditis belari TaxID=2138241 RepID=A0AAF3FIZ2_9BILA
MSHRIRFFFDAHCVNSWIGFKTLQTFQSSGFFIDCIPVLNKRLLYKRRQKEANAKFTYIDPDDIVHGVYKKVASNPLKIPIPEDYERIQGEAIQQRSSAAAMFLTSLKMSYPDRFMEGVESIGEHVWVKRSHVFRGFQIFRLAEQMGFEHRQCDSLVTSLCDYRVNDVLNKSIGEAFQHGAKSAPFYLIKNGDDEEKANDIEEAMRIIDKLIP